MPEKSIHVVGPIPFLNNLLGNHLEVEMGIVPVAQSVEEPPCFKSGSPPGASVVLWDYGGGGLESFLKWLQPVSNGGPPKHLLAIFNIPSEVGIEKDALQKGLRGAFTGEEPLSNIPKGVKAILDGELWFPRQVIAECYLESHSVVLSRSANGEGLTQREKEILLLIAAGQSNQQIADELCVSICTIKSHTYNTFKKINVNSRLQAALWVAKNL